MGFHPTPPPPCTAVGVWIWVYVRGLRFISIIKSNLFWLYYCYIIAFLSIFAIAIVIISVDSNGASVELTSRVLTYCLTDSENCENF